MAYTSEQQELYDFVKASLPRFLFADSTKPEDWVGAFVHIFATARTQLEAWDLDTFIQEASTIWLDQHAKDRGTFRQLNESDEQLRTRLRTFDDAVNPASVLAAATAALTAAGVTIPAGYPGLVETKKDGAYFRQHADANTYKAFLSRGFRMRNIRGSIIIILPYGTDEATRKSVEEAVRLKKAGGFTLVIERRLNP